MSRASEEEAAEAAREAREARVAAREGSGRRLARDAAVIGCFLATTLYLSLLERIPPGRRPGSADDAPAPAPTPAAAAPTPRSWTPPSTPAALANALVHTYTFESGLLDVLSLSVARALLVALAAFAFAADPSSEPRRRTVRLARDAAAFAACVFLTAKGIAHLPDLDAPPRDQAIFWVAWACAFAAVPAEIRAVDDAAAFADARAVRRRTRDGGDDAEDLAELGDPLLAPEDAAAASDVEERDGGTSAKKAPSKTSTFRALLALSVPDAGLLCVAFLFLVLYAVCAASVPHFTGNLVDAVAIDRDPAAFERYALALLLAALGAGAFAGLRGSVFTVQMARLNARVRRRLFDAILAQDAGFFDTNKTGDISSRLNNDCSTVSNALSLNINVALRNLVNVLGVLCFMLALSWPLTLVTLASLPPTLVVSKVYGRYFKQISKRTQKALAEATEVAEETLGSVRTVKSFACEPFHSEAFASKLGEFCRQNRREANYVVGYTFCLTAMPMMVTVLVLWYGGMLVLHGALNPGALVSFMLYQTQLTSCFGAIADVFTAVTTALGAAEKVLELVAAPPRFRAWPSDDEREADLGAVLRPATCEGRVRLTGVTFAYPARPDRTVLTEFDFAADPGTTTALVGPSGGGKSSVVNLIQRFYEPDAGTVTLDGIDLGRLDPSWLKRRVSLVAQEPTLFARSIRRNIAYGLEEPDAGEREREGAAGPEPEGGALPLPASRRHPPLGVEPPSLAAWRAALGYDVLATAVTTGSSSSSPPSEAQIVAAAKAANAHAFISALPRGYDELVGERGSALSGGQKQRVAIARALVRDPSVLLLDEATSALDAESEAAVQEALAGVVAGAGFTTVTVAHRLSTIQAAEVICVVERGRVVERGTHEELVRRKGAYEKLVRHQLGAMSESAQALSRLEQGG